MRQKPQSTVFVLAWLAFVLFSLLPPASAFYNSSSGRWFSRDRIEEHGGLNHYGFIQNDPANGWDQLGLRRGAYEQLRSRPPRTPPDTTPISGGSDECRIQICCGSVSGTVWEHCYIRFDDNTGASGCRGGPSGRNSPPAGCRDDCGCYGTVTARCGLPGEEVMGGDFTRPGQNCTTIGQSADLCQIRDCIRQQMNQFSQECLRYRPFKGPNSNSAVFTAISNCMQMSPLLPDHSRAPGWRAPTDEDERCRGYTPTIQ